MSENLELENRTGETVTDPEETVAEAEPAAKYTAVPEEIRADEETEAAAAETEVSGQFVPVNTADMPLELPSAPESGYVSPYVGQTAPERQRVDENGDPAGERAGLWPRLSAFLIDCLITTVLWLITLFVFSLFTDRLEEPFFFSVKLRTVLLYVVQKIYFILTEWKHQRTLGKRALKIKVISSETFGKADLWTIFFRETFGKFVSSVCVVGDLMLLGKKHLPLYDRLADTEVVYTVNNTKTVKAEDRAQTAEVPSDPAPEQEPVTEAE